ncbi:MAG: hypothetical protein HQL87_15850 [Magnetococcales bacterium]|nr:hypothetical protein [Magnetococcales bacterium]
MNLYFLVEGKRTEPKVYAAWLPLLFAGLTRAVKIEDLQGNHFLILSANGYPFARNLLANVLADVRSHGQIDLLFVCMDAEEETVAARRQELEDIIAQSLSANTLPMRYAIIVQNRTIETWFLGNRRIVSRAPQGESLRQCLQHYSVVEQDPERLPVPDGSAANHATYHHHYLKAIFNEHGLTYHKNNPGEVLQESYLRQLVLRTRDTPHLATLNHFLHVCQDLGGILPARGDSV